MIVQTKPIRHNSWHGKTDKESFARAKVIQAFVDPESRTYATGLSDEEERKYGALLKVDLSKQFLLDTPHPFWDSKMAEIKLENRTQFWNTDNALEYIYIKVMKASKYVANSEKEYEEGLWPEATHVIFDESEEVDTQATLIETKNAAIIQCSELSKNKKIELIMVLSSGGDYLKAKNLKNKSDNHVNVELDKILQTKSQEVLRYLKMDKDFISTYALGLEALQKNVLNKAGHKIMYHDSVIAEDLNDLIDYLNKAENNEFKLRLLALVNQ